MGYYKELNETEIGQLKVGDKVMVSGVETEVTLLKPWGFGTEGWFTDSRGANVKFYGNQHHLHPDTSIPVYKLTGETTMKTKQFTKADLKTGYRIILEDGEVGIVFIDSDIISTLYSRDWVKYINHSNGFDELVCWDNKLNPAESGWVSKVVRVEKPSNCSDIFKLDCEVKTIWEREAPKSKEQIAYDEAVEATEAARQAYELAQKKLEALNPANK